LLLSNSTGGHYRHFHFIAVKLPLLHLRSNKKSSCSLLGLPTRRIRETTVKQWF